jgi:hypothetical protein
MAHEFITLFLLIIIANGTPVFMRFCLKKRLETAIDLGATLPDGQRLFGASKTWRGLVGAILITSLVGWLMGYSAWLGCAVAMLALLGDLFSSFIKRRLALKPGSMAPLLDQIPESLLPAYILMHQFNLDSMDVLFLVICFVITELLLSRLFFMLGVRKTPY